MPTQIFALHVCYRSTTVVIFGFTCLFNHTSSRIRDPQTEITEILLYFQNLALEVFDLVVHNVDGPSEYF